MTEQTKILIIDGNTATSSAMADGIRGPDIEVLEVDCGSRALPILLRQDIALIILNTDLNAADGLAFVKRIKDNIRTVQIPVVVVTGVESLEDVRRAYRCGVVDVLSAPVDTDVLRCKVQVFVDLHGKREELKRATALSAETSLQLEQAIEGANNMALQAEMAAAAKSDFLSSMGHELSSSINTVIGMNEALLETDLSEQQDDLVMQALASAEDLLTLINDVLDFANIEEGKVSLESVNFDLRTLLEDVIGVYTARAVKKSIELHYLIDRDVPALLTGDPGRLRQVIMNLVANAIHFTQEGGVFVKVGLDNHGLDNHGLDNHGLDETLEKDEDPDRVRLHFSVVDTGIGISEEQLEQIFIPFFDPVNIGVRQCGGGGMGLRACKKLAQVMSGQIGVASAQGEGSTFWFTAVFDKQADEWATPLEPGSVENLRVLVVDDGAKTREATVQLLESWGCRAQGCYRRPEALVRLCSAVVEGDPFDVAVIDMSPGGQRGGERIDAESLAAEIKDIPEIQNLAIVMVTAFGQRGDTARLQGIGVEAYLPKPTPKGLLFDCMATLCSPGLQWDNQAFRPVLTRHSLTEARKQRLKILLAEDNNVNQTVAQEMLLRLGLRADVVADGQQALEALSRTAYDIVLMDYEMPVMDGIEAAQTIRSQKSSLKNPDVRIIAMSAEPAQEERARFLDAGMHDCIAKPINSVELNAAIERQLEDIH